MTQDSIRYEARGAVGVITLNRSDKLNALDPGMVEALIKVLGQAEADDQVRVLILTGQGRGFSAGADLDTFLRLSQSGDQEAIDTFTRAEFPLAFARFPKPIIAAINGPAVGWGFTVSLMCDLRLMSRQAKLIAGFLKVGVTPEFGSTFHLPRLVGLGKAMELVLTARPVEADEALDMGLVNEVLEPDELMPRALALAETIAAMPGPAVRLAKQALWQGAGSTLDEVIHGEVDLFRRAMATPEHAEAVAALLKALKG